MITKILLKNYRLFNGIHSIDLFDNPSKSIAEIMANGGQGKATIAKAIYWCLYGYGFYDRNLINNQQLHNMALGEETSVGVKIIFDLNNQKKSLTRKLSVIKDLKGARTNKEFVLVDDSEVSKKEYKEVVDQILPYEFAFLYFWNTDLSGYSGTKFLSRAVISYFDSRLRECKELSLYERYKDKIDFEYDKILKKAFHSIVALANDYYVKLNYRIANYQICWDNQFFLLDEFQDKVTLSCTGYFIMNIAILLAIEEYFMSDQAREKRFPFVLDGVFLGVSLDLIDFEKLYEVVEPHRVLHLAYHGNTIDLNSSIGDCVGNCYNMYCINKDWTEVTVEKRNYEGNAVLNDI